MENKYGGCLQIAYSSREGPVTDSYRKTCSLLGEKHAPCVVSSPKDAFKKNLIFLFTNKCFLLSRKIKIIKCLPFVLGDRKLKAVLSFGIIVYMLSLIF